MSKVPITARGAELLRDEFTLAFPPAATLTADYSLAGADAALARLLADPEVDLILALGLAYAWRWGSIDWIRGGQTDVTVPTRPAPSQTCRRTVPDRLA